MEVLIILVSIIFGGVIGYYFCKTRYRVKTLINTIKLLTRVVANDISPSEIKKELDNLDI